VKGREILKREREIKELNEKKAELKKRVTDEEKALDTLKNEIKEAESEQAEIRDSLHRIEIKLIELKIK